MASASPGTDRPAITLPLLATLALLAAAAPFATDLYLPAFPQMVGDLATSATGVQLSLTAFLLGAGLGQAVFGPLSDRIGRRVPLIVGTALYVLAAVVAAMAGSVPLLVAARLVQGLTGAAGMVIGRAVITDLAHGREAARAFSLMMLVGGVAPVIAPVAGSLLVGPLGWRGLLWIVAGLGLVALVASVALVPETHHPRQAARGDRMAMRDQLRMIGRRRFLGNALAYSFAFGTMMAYISASPFLYQELMGFSAVEYGALFAVNALLLMVVGGMSARLTVRFTPVQLGRVGLLTNLAAIVAIAVLTVTGVPVVWLIVPIPVAVASLGLVFGPVTALALDEVRQVAGLGSAAIGVLQFGIAAAVAPVVSVGGGATVVPLAITMLAASVIANLAYVLAGHRILPRTSTALALADQE